MACLGLTITPASSDLDVLDVWNLEHGNITAYGYKDGEIPQAAAEVTAQKRSCNGGSVKCSTSHQAGQQLCVGLITALVGAVGQNRVNNSPRAYCYEASGQGGGKCCVSWSSVVNGQFQDFVDAASAISNTCGAQKGGVSGEIKGAQVRESCTNVCVSNRPNGCT